MITIYKYKLSITDVQTIKMSKGAKVLDIQFDKSTPTQLSMWAAVDTELEVEQRVFRMFGTGRPVEREGADKLLYLSTIQCFKGLVVHVFEYKIV